MRVYLVGSLWFLLSLPTAFLLHAEDQDKESLKPVQGVEGKQSVEKLKLTDTEWKERLTAEQFHIVREKGTERAFTGAYWNHKGKGIYHCIACDAVLFDSETKFDSGTGWPSFYAPVAEEDVSTETDRSFFMKRTEVLCARCDGHLGHVFEDGPKPTGLRYCINSLSLDFKAEATAS